MAAAIDIFWFCCSSLTISPAYALHCACALSASFVAFASLFSRLMLFFCASSSVAVSSFTALRTPSAFECTAKRAMLTAQALAGAGSVRACRPRRAQSR